MCLRRKLFMNGGVVLSPCGCTGVAFDIQYRDLHAHVVSQGEFLKVVAIETRCIRFLGN